MRSAINTAKKLGRRFGPKAVRTHFGWRPKIAREIYSRASDGDPWANVVLLEAIRRLCAYHDLPFQTDLSDFV